MRAFEITVSLEDGTTETRVWGSMYRSTAIYRAMLTGLDTTVSEVRIKEVPYQPGIAYM